MTPSINNTLNRIILSGILNVKKILYLNTIQFKKFKVNILKILTLVLCSFISAAQNKPNILIIHVDDLGYHDLSVHGSKIYQTPNIDKLATESVSFTKAYANYPRCVPSRLSIDLMKNYSQG